MSFNYKDFLYLDNDFVADLYGQIYQEEIIEKILNAGNASIEQTGDVVGNSESETGEFSGGGSLAIASLGASYNSSSTSHKEEQVIFSEETNSSESVTVAINNFKYTKVIEGLENSGLLDAGLSLKQHSFLTIHDTFEYYDFELDNDIFSFDNIIEFMYTDYYTAKNQFFNVETIKSDYKNAATSVSGKKPKSPFKSIQEAEDYLNKLGGVFNFKYLEVVSKNLATIFKGNILLLSNNNHIIICNKKFLKTNSASLIMSKEINATVTGRVINNPEMPIDATKIENYVTLNENGQPNTKSMLTGGAAFMIMNYLQHFTRVDANSNLFIIQAIGVEYS